MVKHMNKFEKFFLISGNLIFICICGLIYSTYNCFFNCGKKIEIIFWIIFILMEIRFTIIFNKINNLAKKIERKEK